MKFMAKAIIRAMVMPDLPPMTAPTATSMRVRVTMRTAVLSPFIFELASLRYNGFENKKDLYRGNTSQWIPPVKVSPLDSLTNGAGPQGRADGGTLLSYSPVRLKYLT